MRSRPVLTAVLAAALAVLLIPAAAPARDPGRWHLTARHTIPIRYYQGMAAGHGALFFDGIENGLYRTTLRLHQTAGVPDGALIPPSVALTQKYNHIGDLSYDPRGRGRVLLPLECYDPAGKPSTNCAGSGAIGVADPRTLAWRYDVTLAGIPKAMWCEVSPDHRLLWTSAGNDLLAYRLAGIHRSSGAGCTWPARWATTTRCGPSTRPRGRDGSRSSGRSWASPRGWPSSTPSAASCTG
jgi:hypothetical protein